MILTFENWEHRGEGNAGTGPAPSVPVPRLSNTIIFFSKKYLGILVLQFVYLYSLAG
jgi:hypothetical protein